MKEKYHRVLIMEKTATDRPGKRAYFVLMGYFSLLNEIRLQTCKKVIKTKDHWPIHQGECLNKHYNGIFTAFKESSKSKAPTSAPRHIFFFKFPFGR